MFCLCIWKDNISCPLCRPFVFLAFNPTYIQYSFQLFTETQQSVMFWLDRRLTRSIGLLSYTFLMRSNCSDIFVPAVSSLNFLLIIISEGKHISLLIVAYVTKLVYVHKIINYYYVLLISPWARLSTFCSRTLFKT